MDFTGGPLKGMVYVEEAGFEADADPEAWMTRAPAFTDTLQEK